MSDQPIGGTPQPVSVSTDAPAGTRHAIRVRYVTDQEPAGGPALPIYEVSDAEIAAGTYLVGGEPLPLPVAAVTDGRPVVGQRPIPVYVVGSAPEPPAWLRAYWTLDDAGGLIDAVSGRVLTWTGTPAYAAGIIDDAASFDGASYLTTPDAADLHATPGFVISFWIKPTTVRVGAVFAARDPLTGADREWFFYDGATSPSFGVANAGGGVYNAQGGTLTAGNWHHIVGALTTTDVRFFLDGALIEAKPFFGGSPTPATQPMMIGADTAGNSRYTGVIDEIAIGQGIADSDIAAIVAALYNGGAGARPTGV